jgi:hypothetical protein
MGPKPTWVAWSHEFDEEHGEELDERTQIYTNPIQFGLLSTAQTAVPIESLKGKARGRIPEQETDMQSIESMQKTEVETHKREIDHIRGPWYNSYI